MTKEINKKISTLAVLALLFASKHAFAQESFNNNLLKAELHKSAIGGVKVVLFTGKPYTDAVTVNKKADNEYVILLPETSNSSTGRPSLRLVSDVIKDVEIKTQPYQNNIKGYTKVVIRSNKPLEISTNVQTLNPSVKLSEREYKELLSQASKSVPKKVDNQKPAKLLDSSKSQKTAQSKNETVKKVQEKVSSKSLKVAEKPKQQKNISKQVYESKIIAPAKPKAVKNIETSKNDVQKIEQKEILQPQVKKESLVVPKVETNVVQAPPKLVQEHVKAMPLTFEQKLKRKASNVLLMLKNDVYLAIGSISALFILLLLIARRMTKSITKSQVNFNTHLQDRPETPIDYSEKITDDMSWKEKFKACTEPETVQESPSQQTFDDIVEETFEDGFVSQVDLNENASKMVEIDELFTSDSGFDEFIEDTRPEENLEQDASIASLDSYIQAEDSFGEDVSVDDIFAELESDESALVSQPFDTTISQESKHALDEENIVPISEAQNGSEIVKSEFVIDSQTSLYLVDFEDSTALVGSIEDEIFVLKRFESKIDAKLKARLSEQSFNSTQYMTRVGDFRGIVEVTPDKMDLLIEL